jgi:hypothetical protein
MNNNITILNQLLNYLPIYQFRKLIEIYKTDRYTKKFNSFHQFIVLFVAQMMQKDSLRDIETTINLSKMNLNFFSLPLIRKSTLSDSINKRNYKVFEEFFYVLLDKLITLTPNHSFKFKNELYAIDTTTIDLCLNIFPWAKFRKQKGAIRIHAKLNQKGNIPEFLVITDGKKHEVKAAKEHFKFKSDSIIVMDKGFIDFKWLYSLNQQGVFFVTRAKKNMNFEITGQHKFTEGTGVMSDDLIVLNGPKASKDYPQPLRMVTYYDYKTKIIYQFITNNFKLASKTIADIYKSRWQVELFFKWIKQNLKIKSFLGTSKNAVMSQIWVAMILYLLIAYIKFRSKSKISMLELTRIFRATLFQRLNFIDLLGLKYEDVSKIPIDDLGVIQLKFVL